MKRKVLIITPFYIPGIKGGGPIQSIKNLVDNLSKQLDFYIITSDRDLNEIEPYSNIVIDEWMSIGPAKVLYTNPSKLTPVKLCKIMNRINYDVIYLNSFFSFKFSIMPVLLSKLRLISNKKIVIAPRGEFSKGAIGLKKFKKNTFIKFVKLLKLYNDIIWHATAISEKHDIIRVFGQNERIKIASNLVANFKLEKSQKNRTKKEKEIKVIFVSRVHPKKNLKKAISILGETKGKIEFNIFGPIEDKNYWNDCLNEIKKLPKHIEVSYKGVLNHKEVIKKFKSHHIFLFPTLGENYGHVIIESLLSGCPVIISDQTPWRNLESLGIGYDIDLKNHKKFVQSIQSYIDMNGKEYQKVSQKTSEVSRELFLNENSIEDTLKLFK